MEAIGGGFVHKRFGMLTAAVLAAGMVFAIPAQADTCRWIVEDIKTPEGYDPASARVSGTDSKGNFSGTVTIPGQNNGAIVLWTNGEPRVASEFANFNFPQVNDENSAGTVLVTGVDRAGAGEWGVYLYTGGHIGNGAVTQVQAPEGYRAERGIALNDRGEVLFSARSSKDEHVVTVLWSMVAARPIVIDTPLGQGVDLDNDGTVLLHAGNTHPGYLWRAGQIIPLSGKGSFVGSGAIRGGKVVRTESTSPWPEAQSWLWENPDEPRPIEDGGTAWIINSNGLIVGGRSTHVGPSAVWRNTTLLAELPMPDGVRDASGVFVVGDDDVIYGDASNYGPLKWSCSYR